MRKFMMMRVVGVGLALFSILVGIAWVSQTEEAWLGLILIGVLGGLLYVVANNLERHKVYMDQTDYVAASRALMEEKQRISNELARIESQVRRDSARAAAQAAIDRSLDSAPSQTQSPARAPA
jgi:hypothetical protein